MEQHDQDKEALVAACLKMETIAIEFFAGHGWRFRNRICSQYLISSKLFGPAFPFAFFQTLVITGL
jgi:hypothetical protein